MYRFYNLERFVRGFDSQKACIHMEMFFGKHLYKLVFCWIRCLINLTSVVFLLFVNEVLLDDLGLTVMIKVELIDWRMMVMLVVCDWRSVMVLRLFQNDSMVQGVTQCLFQNDSDSVSGFNVLIYIYIYIYIYIFKRCYVYVYPWTTYLRF